MFLLPGKREVIIVDPLISEAHYTVLGQKAILQYIQAGTNLGWDFGESSGVWTISSETASKQDNTYDCGRYVIEAARRFVEDDLRAIVPQDLIEVEEYIIEVRVSFVSFVSCLHYACPRL